MERVIRRNSLVQEAKSSYHLGFRIREQRIVDAHSLGEVPERLYGVKAQGGYLEALPFEIPAPAFQLDQLAFAKRSPVRGALEKEQ